jgi:hypothetical protein
MSYVQIFKIEVVNNLVHMDSPKAYKKRNGRELVSFPDL